jgi:hypothetical protein
MEEKDLIELMDALADTEIQLDLVTSERETLKKKQIPLNIQTELESIDMEFEPKIESVKENIKVRKEQLQTLLKEFGKPLKSKSYSWSYDIVGEWDDEQLCRYAASGHPEILILRKTKEKTRLTPKKSKI